MPNKPEKLLPCIYVISLTESIQDCAIQLKQRESLEPYSGPDSHSVSHWQRRTCCLASDCVVAVASVKHPLTS